MSTRAIQGKNVTVRAARSGVMLPFACATSCNIHFSTELIERTSVGAGHHAKFKPRKMSTTAELGGITHIIPQQDAWTVFQVAEDAIRMSGLDIEMEFVDGEGNYKRITGHVLMPEIDVNAGADGFSEDTINFQFSGVPGLFNDPPPSNENTNNVDWNLYRGAGGEFGFTDTQLIGRPKYHVFRGGPLNVITSGTPTVQQVRINTATGQVTFNSSLDPGEPVYYQWRIS